MNGKNIVFLAALLFIVIPSFPITAISGNVDDWNKQNL